MDKKIILQAVVAVLFLAGIPWNARGEMGDIWKKFHPHLTVREEYTDNRNLTPSNKKEDYITTVLAGLRFSTLPVSSEWPGLIRPGQEGPSGIDLDYTLGYVSYAKRSEDNYVSHSGRLNAWYSPNPRITMRLKDYFIRSDEPREREYAFEAVADQYLLATQRERSVYIRNVFEPSLTYRFGPENNLSLLYRNNYYDNKNPLIQDSRENYLSPTLVYWFSARQGLTLQYGYTHGEFERTADLNGHMGRATYTYRFNPRSSVFAEYVFLYRDFSGRGYDYMVHTPSVGLEHTFTPDLRGNLQAGYYWYDPRSGSSEGGLSVKASLTQRWARTRLSLGVEGGYREDYFTSENLGFTKYYRGHARLSHQILPRVSVGLSGSLERAEFLSDRKDWIWKTGGDISYGIFRWLSLSLEAFHRERDSNLPSAEYKENRVMISLSASL